MAEISTAKQLGGRPLTGRTVLIWLIGFFAIVFAVNAVMISCGDQDIWRA